MKRKREHRQKNKGLCVAVVIAIALSAGSAAAHTLDDGIPQTNGLRIDMAAVAAYLHGDSTLPAPRLAGTLGLGDTILRCAELLRDTVPLLSDITGNAARINALCESIRVAEGEADDIHDDGVTELFRRISEEKAPDGAMRFIAVREVFDQLERVVDLFDDAANQVESIVIEHV